MVLDAVVLDVGHAGCTVLMSDQRTIVVDAGNVFVKTALGALGVSEIDALVLSHRHRDHTSGAFALLQDPGFRVDRLITNAHPGSPDLADLVGAVGDARTRHDTELITSLNETSRLSGEDLSVEVLWPDIAHAAEGLGGTVEGKRVGVHRLASVMRISAWDGESILLCADAERRVLDGLITNDPERLRAETLVYPHHGGRSQDWGTPDQERAFAERLVATVQPRLVIFSNGRGAFDNPRGEILQGVMDAGAEVRIACTQINERCGGVVREVARSLPGAGTALGHACAGTVRIDLADGDRAAAIRRSLNIHEDVVAALDTAQCRQTT
jgi:competence protein ComEC